MAYRFSPEDVAFLSSAAGEEALFAAEEFAFSDQTMLADLTRLRAVLGAAGTAAGRTAAVAETARLRRRATERWGAGFERWLFTDEALQQAAPPLVAAHRAARLSGRQGPRRHLFDRR